MSETPAAAFGTADPSSEHEPRTTGEIISDAIGVLRRAFPVIFSLAVPLCAVEMLLRETGWSFMATVWSLLLKHGGASTEDLQAAWPHIGIMTAFFTAAFAVQQLLVGTITVVAEKEFAGRSGVAWTAISRMGARGAPLVLTSLLFALLVLGAITPTLALPVTLGILTGSVAGLVTGIVLGLAASLVVLLVLTLRWSLFAPIVVGEGRSMFAALSRSSEMTAPRGLPFAETPRFRLSVMLLVATGITGVLQSLFVVPRLAVAFLTGWSFSDGGLPGLIHLPLWFAVPFGLIEVVTNAAVIPLSGLLLALFSFDLRVRYEQDQA